MPEFKASMLPPHTGGVRFAWNDKLVPRDLPKWLEEISRKSILCSKEHCPSHTLEH